MKLFSYYTHYDHSAESQARARADFEKLVTPWRPRLPNPAIAYARWGVRLAMWGLDRYYPDDAAKVRDFVRHRSSVADTPALPFDDDATKEAA